jgi:hypothetical protein
VGWTCQPLGPAVHQKGRTAGLCSAPNQMDATKRHQLSHAVSVQPRSHTSGCQERLRPEDAQTDMGLLQHPATRLLQETRANSFTCTCKRAGTAGTLVYDVYAPSTAHNSSRGATCGDLNLLQCNAGISDKCRASCNQNTKQKSARPSPKVLQPQYCCFCAAAATSQELPQPEATAW